MTTEAEGGDRLSIEDLQRQDAAKPFAERCVQRLREDEVEGIICHLRPKAPKPPSMTPLRIGVEISGFAQSYLQMKQKEEAARHTSKVQRGLNTVVLWICKVVEWTNRHGRRRSTGIARFRKAIEQLEKLANDEAARAVLGLSLDEEATPALRELRRALESTRADTNAPLDLSKTQDLREFIQHLLTQHIEEIRDHKTSRRRSVARGLFLDRLADFYFRFTEEPPTFTREKIYYVLDSAFGDFATAVFEVVERESILPIPKRRVPFEDDINAAVIRFSPAPAHFENDTPVRFNNEIYKAVVSSSSERRWLQSSRGKNIAPNPADPRDRKSARGRIRRGT